MSDGNAVTEKDGSIVGTVAFSPLSEKERLHEIDMRVGARLAEREILRGEYVRGVLDTVTVVFFIAALVYVTFFLTGEEE
jgi:hypothetical protein